MASSRVIVVGAIALVVAGAVGALHSGDHNSTARPTIAPTSTVKVTPMASCKPGDLDVAVGVRRPSRVLQSAGIYATDVQRPVATIVVRNNGAQRCLFDVGGFHLTIRDRTGMLIGEWDDDTWLATSYSPGSQKQFSLPDVYRCDRPGPFVAEAEVGPTYTARRGNLSRKEITC